MSKQIESIRSGLVVMRTLLSRDPCIHADVAIGMIDAMLAEQPAQQDLPDLIAGALGVSRGTAYDMMREALAEQPAQEPLTDEQIRSIWSDGDCFEEVAFARAIEAAHGITKGTP